MVFHLGLTIQQHHTSSCQNLLLCSLSSLSSISSISTGKLMYIQNSLWDHTTFYNPISLQLMVPKWLPPDTPFTPSLPLSVNMPINNKGKGNIFIDDTIFIIPNINDNLEQAAKAAPLAITTFARPVTQSKLTPRKPIISMIFF
jgi:hypothetical protein